MQKQTKIKGFEKLRLILVLALMSAIAPLATDMYLPALHHVQESFQTSAFLTQLSLASFFIAFALGQLIYGPLSDIFGRKKPLYVGMILFMLSSLGCVLIDSVEAFIVLRFFEALGGCAGAVIARAIVNDLFELKEAASIFALLMVVHSLAPMLSPTFGSLLLEFFSWYSIFITLFGVGILLLFLLVFSLKESANTNLASEFSFKEILSNYKTVLKDKIFLLYTLAGALAMAGMFAYITGSSFVFIGSFGLSEQQFGILFGVNALGFMIFANINARLVLRYSPYKILAVSFVFMFAMSVILVLCAFLTVSFWFFELALFFTIAMLGFLLPNITTLAMARFMSKNSGTASAVLGTTQFGFAGISSFVVGILNANSPVFLGLLICVSSFLAVLSYVFCNKINKVSLVKG
ncbi:multidrug effflux MFS transporter [Campylobacter troglodytis]|uniref:multidrug effflux MFS transporter n=1 Tax=Campylobacter troglodytis TaxID=654363 RepID=UPI00115B74E2|nr:multidrug effflux MFS transporter [Campylobacter troglodytis]TQR59582.1 Bcr/CflA family drug resistance efflux transporter [Campylobacter troglodytis]